MSGGDGRPRSQPTPAVEGEFAQAVRWLQRATGDPMADAAPGRLTVTKASDPAGRSRYQQCRLELLVAFAGDEASGAAPVVVAHEAVFPRKHWPEVGQVVPAMIARSDPRVFEAAWEAAR